MATNPQGMFKDLISTIEEKVNKPLAQSSGKLTNEFFSDPSATRSRVQQENAGNPLNPLDVDRIVGQRRGNIAGQLQSNTQLASGNADLLNSFFNFASGLAEQSRLAQSSSASNAPKLQLVETAEGLRPYNPQTGELGDVVGQGPQERSQYGQGDIDSFAQALLDGDITITSVPSELRSQVLSRYEQLKNSNDSGGLAGMLQGIPVIGGFLSQLLGGK